MAMSKEISYLHARIRDNNKRIMVLENLLANFIQYNNMKFAASYSDEGVLFAGMSQEFFQQAAESKARVDALEVEFADVINGSN